MNCPNCGKEANWIEQYSRYYCYNCKAYLAAGLPAPAAPLQTNVSEKVLESSIKTTNISAFSSYTRSFNILFKNPVIFVPVAVLFAAQFLTNYFITGAVIPELFNMFFGLFGLLTVGFDPMLIVTAVIQTFSQIILYFVLFITVNLIIYAFATTSYMIGAKRVVEQGSVKLGDLLRSSFNRTVKVIAGLFLWGLIISIGLMMLVIPGLILALLFFYTMPVYALEDKGVIDSLKHSFNVGKINVGKAIGFGFVTILFLIGFGIVSSIASSAFEPSSGLIANVTTMTESFDLTSLPSLFSSITQQSLISSIVSTAINTLIIQPIILIALAVFYLRGIKKPQ